MGIRDFCTADRGSWITSAVATVLFLRGGNSVCLLASSMREKREPGGGGGGLSSMLYGRGGDVLLSGDVGESVDIGSS